VQQTVVALFKFTMERTTNNNNGEQKRQERKQEKKIKIKTEKIISYWLLNYVAATIHRTAKPINFAGFVCSNCDPSVHKS
jgi:hypothetical protein